MDNTTAARSPSIDSARSGRSFSRQISAIGARISGAMSHSRERSVSRQHDDETSSTTGSTLHERPGPDRSVSRGRDAYYSSGRGGAGNIRPSPSREPRESTDAADDISVNVTRGREPTPNHAVGVLYSTGRGGVGNIRSPSRHGEATIPEDEEVIIKRYAQSEVDAPRSTGRGGVGNISTSRSRSRGPSGLISTGRGGAGNMYSSGADTADVFAREERERKHAAASTNPSSGLHSTGRGGIANITNVPPTIHNVEKSTSPAAQAPIYSSGRGGRGNMIRRTSVEV
ncbi:hypothetical protein BDV98DRAFT_604119 [Pterulicium gracile]|uniref:Uncharacterized protein n=1 Tax=Pterulicium gracile TaxID=1884261 RepID=A0A5C3QJH8_9AGAR|nr:hypothetical protein BDV98DRAFT_604119 [Pterula gracilis]